MYYKLFKDTHAPEYWDAEELWIVQMVLSSCIASEGSGCLCMSNERKLKELLYHDFMESIELKENACLFAMEKTKTNIISKIDVYIKNEAGVLYNNIITTKCVVPIPEKKAIMSLMKGNPRLLGVVTEISRRIEVKLEG